MFSSANEFNSAVSHSMQLFTDLQHPAGVHSDIESKYPADEGRTMKPKVSRCVMSGGLPSLS